MGKEKYLAQVKDLVNRSPYYRLLGIEIVKMKKGTVHPSDAIQEGVDPRLGNDARWSDRLPC